MDWALRQAIQEAFQGRGALPAVATSDYHDSHSTLVTQRRTQVEIAYLEQLQLERLLSLQRLQSTQSVLGLHNDGINLSLELFRLKQLQQLNAPGIYSRLMIPTRNTTGTEWIQTSQQQEQSQGKNLQLLHPKPALFSSKFETQVERPAKKAKRTIVCPHCGHENHDLDADGKGELVCDACGEVLSLEQDDTAEAVETKKTGRLPVTILSGFLGSGKTTLLKYILESKDHQLKIAVIVNDMAEIDIDAAVVQQQVVQTEREVVKLDNGCICCTLRGDLIREIARIKQMQEFDYVIIESTGIAEPQQVAEAFVFSPETQELAKDEQSMLWTQAQLDTCVTVVDADNFARQLQTLQRFADQFEDGVDATTKEGQQEGKKSIAELLVEQVEFADVILINKIDLVSASKLGHTQHLIRSLNPKAKLIPTQFGKVSLTEILHTNKFNMKEAQQSAGWLLSLNNNDHSEANEYGVTSFVYRARSPFHAPKLTKWIYSLIHPAPEWMSMSEEKRQTESDGKHQNMLAHYGNILRSKGWCWFAGKDSYMFGFSQNGRIGSLVPIMEWYTCVPEQEWGVKDKNDVETIKAKFVEPHGDRRQEIVFIGTDLKADAIRAALDACLLTEKELEDYDFYNDDEL